MELGNSLSLFALVLSPVYAGLGWSLIKVYQIQSRDLPQLKKRITENHNHITDLDGTHNPKPDCEQCKDVEEVL